MAPDERIYAVGDIHGRVRLLERMLERIEADIAAQQDDRRSRIVFLGDYIDRGDQAREVLDTLVRLRAEFKAAELVFLRGNHEDALLSFLADPSKGSNWLHFGGLQTLVSYGLTPPKSAVVQLDELERLREGLEKVIGPHWEFLEATERLLRSGDVVFVHAGLDPACPLEAQSDDALLWGRSDFLIEGGVSGLRVVHGHYADAEAVVTPRRVCIDTGAYYSGRLTAARLDSDFDLFTITAFGS
ncbi:metallophosphoesterase family protein [Amaricoccus macauensis]|uniref:metallophosphoesterase family protein n=1 Tax=Amaricoccus macauensis TaxID=57001 RepID=UPI003C7ED62D